MKKFALIVAGGKGERMQADLPKQFIIIAEKPLLMHTIEAFYAYDKTIEILLVLPAIHTDYWQMLCNKFHFTIPHKVIIGGATRFHSVFNGLQVVSTNALVAVHDGVRPFVSKKTLENCFTAAKIYGSAVPSIALVDSIRYFDEKGNKSLNRSNYCLIQTPQVFLSNELLEAYKQPYNEFFTDDASVLEAMGKLIHLVEGNPENSKITTANDLLLAEVYLSKQPK